MSEDFAWSDILDDAAEGWERAHVDVNLGALKGAPAHLIRDLWDPARCPVEFLPLLADSMASKLFEDVWTEDQKREWLARTWEFESKRGTLAGVRMALAASGYTITDVVRPPQGFYVSPDLSAEELNAYLRLQPEIRTTSAPRYGQDNGQFHVNADFVDDGAAGYDDGALLFGRFAYLRRNGVDTPLVTLTEVKSTTQQSVTDFEQYAIPGLSTIGWFVDDAMDDDLYVDAEETPPGIVTYRVDTTFDVTTSDLALTTLTTGLQPYDARVEHFSESEPPGPWVFADGAFSDDAFMGIEYGQYLMGDSVRLYDPSIPLPSSAGVSFVGADRIGIELRTAELMVDLHTREPFGTTFVEEAFSGETYAVEEDTSHEERAIRAVEAGRGFLDRVLIRFDTVRPLEVQDMVTEATRVGDWVRNSL